MEQGTKAIFFTRKNYHSAFLVFDRYPHDDSVKRILERTSFRRPLIMCDKSISQDREYSMREQNVAEAIRAS